MSAGAADVRQAIEDGELSRFQALAIGLCVALNMLDGFDVLVMAFTASEVAKEWSLSGASLGTLLSAGLFGMSGGSLFVAPWADRFGRRATMLFCLVLITLGMLLSSLSRTPAELLAMRVVTGVGVGGILASLTVITAEYAPRRWRPTAISLSATGYPIGATVGGVIAAVLIARYGWRSAFLLGALGSAAMIPLVLRQLPESLDYLLARRPPDALGRLNHLLVRMGRAPVDALPPPPNEARRSSGNPLAQLFGPGVAFTTLLIWAAFFLVMVSFYFVTSWTPKLLVAAGLSTSQGITGGVLLNLGGILGGSVFSYLASRLPLRLLASLCFAGTAAGMALFGAFATDLRLAFPIAFAVGVTLFGSMIGLYAAAPTLYPAAFRTTGMGWAIGIGRVGAIVAPFGAGLLVDRGWETLGLYLAFAVPIAVAVIVMRGLKV